VDKANEIIGEHRGRWVWENNTYTSYGALIPQDVLMTDEARKAVDMPLKPDYEVLDMTPVLPPEAVPAPYTLSPVPPYPTHLPSDGPARPPTEYPDVKPTHPIALPPGEPDQGLPGAPGTPTHPIAGAPGEPNQDLPPAPDQGLPPVAGSPGRPSHQPVPQPPQQPVAKPQQRR
jgi:hypothetical protein